MRLSSLKSTFLVIILFLGSNYAFAAIEISKSIYKSVPFSSQFIEDGALIRNVDYKSVNSLIPQLNEIYGLKLEDRGEAHITVITPPEAQGWFTDKKGINFLISSLELHNKYFPTLQKTKFEVICVGKQQNSQGNVVFYLVIDSPELIKIRKEIQKELENRAKFLGKKTFFDAEKQYYPHITIGYKGGDVHGVSKGIETCIKHDLDFIKIQNSPQK